MIDHLSLYRIFYVTADCGNISRASEKLYISQPAVSKSLQKLEESLNTVLFHRTSRGVTLTEDGQLLYRHVKDAFSSLETGEELLERKHRLGITRLRIGVSTTLCKYILLPYLKEFIAEHPHVKVTITCQSTYKTLELLKERKIDVGLIGETSQKDALCFYPIRFIQDTFVSTKAYLDNLKIRNGNDTIYSSATFMMLDEENITRQWISQSLMENQIELQNILEVSTMDLLIEFAKIGLGIACVIREFVEKELIDGTLIEVGMGIELEKRRIGLICNEGDLKETTVYEFLKKFQIQ
ncbi:MAG: LysR family transcriptional regulator [Fusicatenibacter sp.]|nr:LysR family transcriptional regulator [Lachnospiraceae bacterium]MDY2937472.1 LysR family transcriptional regulator [Fusicatenibacter sp.]